MFIYFIIYLESKVPKIPIIITVIYELSPSSCCVNSMDISRVLFVNAFMWRANVLMSSMVAVPNRLWGITRRC